MPKVSIIIPAYNAMDYLPTTLANLLQQTFEDFEVIIVNDGSSCL
ncbi:MAG: glycosyltransferase family 2 protein, partial [Leptolyngbyaceae cyanobacterium]